MTREEFRNGIQDALVDLAKGDSSELAEIINEFRDVARKLREHDAELASMVTDIAATVDKIGKHIVARAGR